MAEYIDRILLGDMTSHGMVHYEDIMSMPTADVVERKVLDQVYWERDTALHQLAEIGKGLGEKMDDVVERKHGKWVLHNMIFDILKCTSCGSTVNCNQFGEYYRKHWNFCPNCGADMRIYNAED